MTSSYRKLQQATLVGAVCIAVASVLTSASNAAIIDITGDAELVVDYAINYDYNSNNFVDSADYVVWRNNLGPGGLPNENGVSPGFINQNDCTLWKSRFGSNTFFTHKLTVEADQNARRSPLLQAINEQQNVFLSASVATNNPPYEQAPAVSGVGWEQLGTPISAEQYVSSHYIWLNAPTGYLAHNIATFQFDGPILGLIGGPAQLIATNGLLGFTVVPAPNGAMVNYTPTTSGFVNEAYPNNPSDPPNGIPASGDIVIILAPDTLRVDFTSFSGDYVRVVTAAPSGSGGGAGSPNIAFVPEPMSIIQLVGGALLSLTLFRRRR